MASVRPYRRRPHHWEATVSLGPDPIEADRYLRRTFVLCPASCREGCSPFPRYRARTKLEAQRAATRIEVELRQGAPAGSTPTFRALVDAWIEYLALAGRSRNTLHSYRSLADLHLLPAFGDRPAGDITPREIQARIDDMLASGLSPATCERALSVARQVYRWAVKRVNGVEHNPAREVDRPPQTRRVVEIPSAETVQLALIVLERLPWLRVFATLAATTGARRGELCALRWGDVDLAERSLHISRSVNRWREIGPTKTHQARRIHLGDLAALTLEDYRSAELAEVRQVEGSLDELPHEWLIFSSDQGRTVPRNPDAVTRAMARVLASYRAEHPGVLPERRVWMHGLRHYAASNMLRGGDPVETAQVLGHSSPKMTLDVYGHTLDISGRDAIERLGRSLSPR